jgi:F0F1-type ATP synthase assembly protein I
LFLAVGWGVDRYFNTSPWGIVIGIILGAVVGFYQFIRISKQID